jgi:membrane protease YdiL (CAAX protease family)
MWLTPIRRHPLAAFFVLAFALTWAIMVPLVLGSYGIIPFPEFLPLLIVMGYGPTFAALIVTAAVGGRQAVRALLGRLLLWRVGWRWWAVTLFLNAAVVLGALGLYALLGNDIPPFPGLGPALLLDLVLTFLVSGLINGEEIGWRGFATPRLLERYGVLGTVAVLGVLETLFHLPIFFNNGASAAGGQNGTPFLAFLASAVLLVVLFTWLYQHTRGSLLIATAFHASANTWTTILPFPSTSPTFGWLMVAAQVVVVSLILVAGGTSWLRHRETPAEPSASLAPGTATVRP